MFWLPAAFVMYVDIGYPLILQAWARVRARHCGLRIADCGFDRRSCECRPSHQALTEHSADHGDRQSNPQSAIRNPQWGVSIVMAARNEGPRLADCGLRIVDWIDGRRDRPSDR